jgi:hypothetical protein
MYRKRESQSGSTWDPMGQDGHGRANGGALLVALILAGSGVLAACASSPRPPASVVPVISPTPDESPRATPATAGGYRWTPVHPDKFRGVALGAVTSTVDQRLIAVGTLAEAPDGTPGHPAIWASADGITWSRLPDSLAFASPRDRWNEILVDIVSSGNGFVAVGVEQEDDASSANAAAWVSPDGMTWTRATVEDGIGRTMDQVLATNSGFVAFGEAGYDHRAGFGDGTAIWTSRDGRTWTLIPDSEAPPFGTRLSGVVAGTREFVAAAALEHTEGEDVLLRPVTEGVWCSLDAVHWQPIPGTPLSVGEFVPLNDGFVALGSHDSAGGVSNPVAWRSTEDGTWIGVVLPRPAGMATGTSIYGGGLVSGGAGLLVFGTRDDDFSTVGWSSSDGAAWTPLDLTAILRGATIGGFYTARGGIVVLGTRSTAGGDEPAAWLLAP